MKGAHSTLLVLGQAEVAVPAGHQDHVVGEVFALDLQLLHDDDVGLEDVEHGIEGALVAPWLVAERIADAVDVPGGDSDHGADGERVQRCGRLIARQRAFRPSGTRLSQRARGGRHLVGATSHGGRERQTGQTCRAASLT